MQRIDARVEDRAPSESRIQQPMSSGPPKREAEVCRNMPDVTKITGGCQSGGFAKQWIRTGPHGLHEKQAAITREVDQFFGIGCACSKRLFNQHSLSSLKT